MAKGEVTPALKKKNKTLKFGGKSIHSVGIALISRLAHIHANFFTSGSTFGMFDTIICATNQ